MEVSSNYSIPCGYYTCDVRYEFCSTGFATPECLRCSGICSHYRVVNDPVATERCHSLCPEFWRRMNEKSSTEVTSHIPTVEHLTSVEDYYRTIIYLLIVIIVLVVISLLALFGLILLKVLRRSRRSKDDPGSRNERSRDEKKNNATRSEDPEDPGASLLSESRPLANGYVHPRSSTASVDNNTASNCSQSPEHPYQCTNNRGMMAACSGRSLSFRNFSVDNCTTNIGDAQGRSSDDDKDDQTLPKDEAFHTALVSLSPPSTTRSPLARIHESRQTLWNVKRS